MYQDKTYDRSASAPSAQPQKPFPRIGLRVWCNGYIGTVTRICEWSNSMVEVRLASGLVCVDYNDVANCLPA